MRHNNSRGGGHRGGNQNNHNRQNNQNNQNNSNNNNSNQNRNNSSGGWVKLNIRNWTNSKASNNPDGGIESLLRWMEGKTGTQISRSSRSGDTLVISVHRNDVSSFMRMNGWQWAGTVLAIEDASNQNNNQTPSGPRNQQGSQQNNQNQSSQRNDRNNRATAENPVSDAGAEKVEQALVAIITRSYDAGSKFLNLSRLPEQAEIQAIGLQAQPAAKVFSALFVCCETKVFETPLKRQQMVESLSLSGNGLTTVRDCIAAAGTFNHIKNLDLSQNNISDVGELRFWRNRFPNLEHLILSGNPVDTPETQKKLVSWYPKLKMWDGTPIDPSLRTEPSNNIPQGTTAVLELIPNTHHPEVPAGSTYGQPTAEKTGDILMKEQMVLRFSYETRLVIVRSDECLTSNNWDYQKALKNLQEVMSRGQIPNDWLWVPQS